MPIDGKPRRSRHALHTVESLRERVSVDKKTGCWNWKMSLNSHGYGQARHGDVSMTAHRLMFILANPNVSIGSGWICHHCDNRACLNPEHLYLGTPASNQDDRVRRKPNSFSGGKKGEEHQDAKLTERAVRAIRKSPLGYRKLAAIYGVDRTTIKLAKRRITWKHIK